MPTTTEKQTQLDIKITYGAFDKKDANGNAPIWDLAPLMELANWNEAITSLIRYGDGANFKTISQQISEELRAPLVHKEKEGDKVSKEEFRRTDWFKRTGKSAHRFTEAADAILIPDIFSEASSLKHHFAGVPRQTVVNDYPMVQKAVERLESWANTLAPSNFEENNRKEYYKMSLTPQAIPPTIELAKFYRRQGRYPETLIILRESILTLTGVLLGKTGTEERKSLRTHLYSHNSLSTSADPKGLLKRLSQLWRTVGNIRNQVAHAGMREDRTKLRNFQTKTKGFITQLTEIADDARKHIDESGTITMDLPPVEGQVLNISNHPVSEWPETQREAAEDRWGTVVDYPKMPSQIDPKLGPGGIVSRYATSIETYAVQNKFERAIVNGEHRFTVAIVASLQASGIDCFTPTSRRDVQQSAPEATSAERRARFVFDSFQEYPNVMMLTDGGPE